MADWLTLKQLSEKRGIPESTLRCWKTQNYIASSTIDNVVMLDDESVTRFLNAHQTDELSDECLKEIIREKMLEREVALSRFDDELFLLRTLKLHQPLFHTLIGELGALITDDCTRDIFLSVSQGEPISRVAARHGLTYMQTIKTYSGILGRLGENTARIASLRERAIQCLFGKFNTTDPVGIPIAKIFDIHACGVLHAEAEINTVRELLQYASENGWDKLKSLRGLGDVTYRHIIDKLCDEGFIIVRADRSIEPSPEIATMLI